MKYEIVEVSTCVEDLEKQVNKMIELGWKPQGGVAVANSESDEFRYYSASQAMVKE